MIESKKMHECLELNNKSLREHCAKLYNGLQTANYTITQLYGSIQYVTQQNDRTKHDIRELVYFFGTWDHYNLDLYL